MVMTKIVMIEVVVIVTHANGFTLDKGNVDAEQETRQVTQQCQQCTRQNVEPQDL